MIKSFYFTKFLTILLKYFGQISPYSYHNTNRYNSRMSSTDWRMTPTFYRVTLIRFVSFCIVPIRCRTLCSHCTSTSSLCFNSYFIAVHRQQLCFISRSLGVIVIRYDSFCIERVLLRSPRYRGISCAIVFFNRCDPSFFVPGRSRRCIPAPFRVMETFVLTRSR